MNNQDKAFEDPVERAAAALRETRVPEGPSEALLQRTLVMVGAGESSGVQKRGWWSMKMVRRTAVAAGLVMVVGTAAVLAPWSGGARVTFADVVKQIHAAQAVRCRFILDPKDTPAVKLPVMEMLNVEPGWIITTAGSETDNVKVILSMEKHTLVMLSEKQKQATVVDLQDLPPDAPQRMNLLNSFKKIEGEVSKPLGGKEINGHPASGYEVVENGMDMKIWADSKTHLPVYAEMSGDNPALHGGTLKLTEFDWNPKYDARELSVEVPAGYHVMNAQMNASEPTEADVVVMLKKLAELNGGAFPDPIGMELVDQAMKVELAARIAEGTKGMTVDEKIKWYRENLHDLPMKLAMGEMPIRRGWAFITTAKYGTEWHYARGVKLGQKGTPVLWYKPVGKELWRVIEADMTVQQDVKEADLPKGELVKLVQPMPASNPSPSIVSAAVDTFKLNASMPTEADVLVMLTKLAEPKGGLFPDEISIDAFGKATYEAIVQFSKRQVAETKGMTDAETAKWKQENMDEIQKLTVSFGRGWTFMGMTSNGIEWHYGKGGKLGQKGTPILWYKPAGKELWRVIDADMTVHEEKEAPAGGVDLKVMATTPGVGGTRPAGVAQTMP